MDSLDKPPASSLDIVFGFSDRMQILYHPTRQIPVPSCLVSHHVHNPFEDVYHRYHSNSKFLFLGLLHKQQAHLMLISRLPCDETILSYRFEKKPQLGLGLRVSKPLSTFFRKSLLPSSIAGLLVLPALPFRCGFPTHVKVWGLGCRVEGLGSQN